MKRATALRNAVKIAERLHSVDGIILTPGCDYEGVRIKRAWIFGSTVKGSQEPNDLDLLLDFENWGRRRTLAETWPDKRYLHRTGLRVMPSSMIYAYKWISKGMQRVSRHDYRNDSCVAYPRIMIYPRWPAVYAEHRTRSD